jgi:pilus assembly protein CpaF
MTTGAYETLRRVAAERIEELKLDPSQDVEEVRAAVTGLVDGYQARARGGTGLRPLRDPAELTRRLMHSLTGYGPLTELLDRPDIEEIFIEGPRVSFIDSSGRLHGLNAPTSEEENRQIVDRILSTTNRRLDTSNPIEQARVLDGRARLTAVVPPVADHLSVTIRRYTVKDYDYDFLIDRGALTPAAAGLLWAAAQGTTTIVFSGPPGAGKTTMLSAFLRSVPNDKCVRVCEEVRELHVPIVHGSFYEASPPTLDGNRRYTLRDLVKVVLAQRPDLICVGEVRGSEAFELTRAVNAGCGFACTVHSNSARDALNALVNAAVMAGENVTESIVRRVFASSIDLVVHLDRDMRPIRNEDGGGLQRQIREILTISPSLSADDFTTEPIFVRETMGAPLRWTGTLPTPDLTERIERTLPEGVTVQAILSGAWRPHR